MCKVSCLPCPKPHVHKPNRIAWSEPDPSLCILVWSQTDVAAYSVQACMNHATAAPCCNFEVHILVCNAEKHWLQPHGGRKQASKSRVFTGDWISHASGLGNGMFPRRRFLARENWNLINMHIPRKRQFEVACGCWMIPVGICKCDAWKVWGVFWRRLLCR